MPKKEQKKKLKPPFTVSGPVIKGKLQGTRLGFPTANIIMPEGGPSGIYIGRATHKGKTYETAIYIGPDEKILEAHILDFSGQIYNQKITVTVRKKIRETQDFADYDGLIDRIKKDIEEVRSFFKGKKN